MERQYIGARYVPKFADPIEWNDQTSYEALTIVNYMGASYTSKKAVTAGIRPTNTEYWAVTGNYNAQVEAYRQEVARCEENIEEIQNNFHYKTDRDIIFIGDSYGANPRVNNSWCKACAKAMRLADDKWHNLCVSGASFAASGGSHYIDQLIGYTGDRNTITDIVLMGGTNDLSTGRNTIFDSANALVTYAKTNYPNAKVYAGYNSLTIGSAQSDNTWGTFETYNQLGYCGMCVIPNMISFNHNYATLEDGTSHPDSTASNVMGWALASYLLGGELMFNSGGYNSFTFTGADGFTVTTNYGTSMIDHANATIRVDIGRIIEVVTAPTQWANDSMHVIGRFVSDWFKTGKRIPDTPINFAYVESGVYKPGYATLRFNNDGTISLNTLGVITPEIIVISGSLTFRLIDC